MIQTIKMGLRFLKESGVVSTFYRSRNFIENKIIYDRIRKREWNHPVNSVDNTDTKKGYQPVISILVPLYHTPIPFLKDMIASVQSQTYPNWELCLADGGAEESEVSAFVRAVAKEDARIQYRILESNDGISENTNRALEMAHGEFIGLLDHDDLLAPEALESFVEAMLANPEADFFYSDEDKLSADGKSHFNPRYKPDLNMDYLRTNNYICHMVVTRTEIARSIGGFRKKMDGSQDYDFVLRCIEQSRSVCHIPKILYHWRYHSNSTAGNPESKMYCYEAGRQAVQEHMDRIGIDADVTMCKEYGYYKTTYHPERRTPRPTIGVVIYETNGQSANDILTGQLNQNPYVTEMIIVRDEMQKDQNTFRICEKINQAVATLRSEYILIVDAAVTNLSSDAIEELIGYGIREDVDVVGSRVYGKGNRIYHAGIVLGMYGSYGFLHRGLSSSYHGYYGRITMPQNVSAVDLTFTLIRREAWNAAGGLSCGMGLVTSGVDLCMKIKGLKVYNPWAVIQIDRKATTREEKLYRENADGVSEFCRKWADKIKQGDPYYNQNLSMEHNAYRLKSGQRKETNSGGTK